MLWFPANYFYNYGLMYATITSSVVLSNTSPAWVFLISMSLLVPANEREKFSSIKALMILVSLCGFGVIAWEDGKAKVDESEKPVLGDVFTLIAAIFNGLYATYLKLMVPPEKEVNFKFTYFLGFVGLINDIVLLPLFFIFDIAGIEKFEWPAK